MTGVIAYLINQYPKVSHSFIRSEMLALEQRGTTVHRIAMRGWDAELVDPLDQVERERTYHLLRGGAMPLLAAMVRTAITRPGRFFGAVAAAWRLSRGAERGFAVHLIYLAEACTTLRRLRDIGASHLHAHFGTNAATVAMLTRLLGGPSWSFTVHGPEEFDKPLQLKLREKISAAAFVVAISSFGRSQLYRWSDARDWHKVAVVHCAVDPRFFTAAITTPPTSNRLVCVGRLCEQKGQLLLVEAIAALRRDGITAQLVLAGDGEMRDEIEALIAAHGLRDQISITGWVDAEQVRMLIEGARGLVLASFGEGLPVAIMEAMASGRPVLSTYIAGIPELIRNGVDGLLVPAGDVGALADAIGRLIKMDPDEIAAMGKAAALRVVERHTASTEAAKLAALFESAAAAG